jgi:UDP-glucose 4-epimerase
MTGRSHSTGHDPALARLRGASLLVVGGAGFVGGNLVRMALEAGCAQVVVVDNFLSSERSLVPDDARVRLIEGSIADGAVLGKLADAFDYVFHLATYHGNQSSIADPIADHDNNLITTLKLYERLKGRARLKKVVYAASGCTLAPHTFEPAQATQEDGPVPFDLDSPYQISKVVGEFYSVYYWRQHALPTVRARFQNVYGPGEVLGAGRWRGTPATVWRNVTPTFVYRALKQWPLTVENEGRASRDFIYVDDIVRGLVLCALEGQPGDVYNLASGKETTILELAKTVNRLTGNPAPLTFLPPRDWDHAGRRFGSTDKAKRALGFEARIDLDEGLTGTIEWTKANLRLIESCMDKHKLDLERLSAGRR